MKSGRKSTHFGSFRGLRRQKAVARTDPPMASVRGVCPGASRAADAQVTGTGQSAIARETRESVNPQGPG